jgi:hypothetical protein
MGGDGEFSQSVREGNLNEETIRDFMGSKLNKYGMKLCSVLKFNRLE